MPHKIIHLFNYQIVRVSVPIYLPFERFNLIEQLFVLILGKSGAGNCHQPGQCYYECKQIFIHRIKFFETNIVKISVNAGTHILHVALIFAEDFYFTGHGECGFPSIENW